MTMTRVTIHDHGSTIVLPCGLVVESRPHDTASYRQTARDLGYGDDVLAMAQDHDALHSWLCTALGIESHALRQAVGAASDANRASVEESAVIAVQRLVRLARVDVCKLVGARV